jgi:hypothetical protein
MSAVVLKADAAPQQRPKDLYEIGEVPPLVAVKAPILPDPLAPNPIAVLVLVQV